LGVDGLWFGVDRGQGEGWVGSRGEPLLSAWDCAGGWSSPVGMEILCCLCLSFLDWVYAC